MNTTLSDRTVAGFAGKLAEANSSTTARYPGDRGKRQPVHTVYGGAHLFKGDTAVKLGKAALASLDEYGANLKEFSAAIGLEGPTDRLATVYDRVREKLAREPVEDFRIDFEDGYGNRPDEEEDGHAAQAATEVARGFEAGTLPPFIGIRLKPFSDELARRSIRTLDLFVTALHAAAGRQLPPNFVITLPKVTSPEQVEVLAGLLAELEAGLSLASGTLVFELMIEVTQSLLGPGGESNLPRLLDAAAGRCVAAHFGTYDYTACCDITAAHQVMRHPVCQHALHAMKVACAGTGIWLSDGATNIMPVGPHRAGPGKELTKDQRKENRRVVSRAWRLHFEDVRHSLSIGYYQGWDLHPAQLPTRYAAVYSFFLESFAAAAERLSNFVGKAAQATLVGDVFDDAATGQGLLNYFLRAVNCGAITEEEATTTGLTLDEIRGRSFVKILENRRRRR